MHADPLHPSTNLMLRPTVRPSAPLPGLLHPAALRPTPHLDLHPLAMDPPEPPGTTTARKIP